MRWQATAQGALALYSLCGVEVPPLLVDMAARMHVWPATVPVLKHDDPAWFLVWRAAERAAIALLHCMDA